MTAVLAALTGLLACVGVLQALFASRLVVRFSRSPRLPPAELPPITVLKPLYGDEPLLEDALATLCTQDYPAYQIIFGVQRADDPAIAVVRRLQHRFPSADILFVFDPAYHGRNRKVGNLINMVRAARHDVVVIADSDVHARPDYLVRLVAALGAPGVGLVTTLYAGLPASSSLAAALGATQITHVFLPSAVLARFIGRRDCLGATMCLRRANLEAIGGLHALVDHLADDNVLGRRVAALGLEVALADTVPLTTVPESGLAALFRHELRWARTIRALEPAGFAASVLQYPLFWALLALLFSGFAAWSLALFVVIWLLRALAALSVDQALATDWQGDDKATLAFSCPVWLLPLRDTLSVVVMLASYGSRHVEWRGFALHADSGERSLGASGPTEDIETQ